MASIVKGHGARIDETETFVPNGTTVKLYSDFDFNLRTSSALVAIISGNFANPNDEAAAGKPIANYKLYKQDDRFIAQWYAMGAEAGSAIWWVGQSLDDGIRLCNEDGTCDPDTGTHDCTGVFGKVTDSEIVLLACRGTYDEAGTGTLTSAVAAGSSTEEYGDDEDDPLHDVNADMDAWLKKFVEEDLVTDPATAEAKFDALPQGTKALALASGYGLAFSYGRWIAKFASDGDLDGLFNHLRQNTGNMASMMWLVNLVPAYGAALDAAAQRYPGSFRDFMRTSGNEAWSAELKKRPAINAAVQQVATTEGPSLKWADFEELNKALVKGLNEGEGVAFWQYGDVLVIGGKYRQPYGESLLKSGGVEGTLTMAARGARFSRGDVEVSGSADQAAFKKAFAKLSSKSVSFV
jgi:hypothetical protein